jgi:cbb3-type cytochrome oxidase subunit 3
MDINTLRIGITLVTLAGFLWIVYRAYQPSRRAELERQGRSILEDDAGDTTS